MYRIRCEVSDYLSFEVIDQSRDGVLERFKAAVRARVSEERANEAIERVEHRPDQYLETLGPGVTIDGEPFYGYEV